MPFPADADDKIHYSPEDHYLLDDFNVVSLNDSTLNINGSPVTTDSKLPFVDVKEKFKAKGDGVTDDSAVDICKIYLECYIVCLARY